MSEIRHVLGISGGKDSAALAIYLNNNYPEINIDFYFCDTGRELDETYLLIEKMETILNKKITRLKAVANSPTETPFDHYLNIYGGYLPSTQARWCTRKLKLEPFEKYIGNDPVISYVGIRGDENREAYISRKLNIQSIFPFRRNIWSEDVIVKVLSNSNIEKLADIYKRIISPIKKNEVIKIINKIVTTDFNQDLKLDTLLDNGIEYFNHAVFEFLKGTDYPLSKLNEFPLLNNSDVLIKKDIFRILEESGIGIPKYYNAIDFEVEGEKGQYARTRSGCFFCFFQQKIEWIWLYEQHPDLFKKAMEYEKDGYTWIRGERLEDLIKTERKNNIKRDYLNKINKLSNKKTNKLIDIIDFDEDKGCAVCFV